MRLPNLRVGSQLGKTLPNHIQRIFRQPQRWQFVARKPPHFGGVAGGGEIARNPAAQKID
jgi:hypothetical protein